MAAVRFRVSGRVQGVGFRAATRDRALALGVRGHARNLDDGDVEVLAVGDDEAIERLAAWLAEGPPAARVQALRRMPADDAGTQPGFATG